MAKRAKTKTEIKRDRYLIDASNFRLGRLASKGAQILRGKHKVSFAPNLDQGDYLIVINAAKIKISGNKREEKIYYHPTGYIGNLKSISLGRLMEKNPALVIKKAISGMIANNRLKKGILKRLEISVDEKQPYQKKKLIEIKKENG